MSYRLLLTLEAIEFLEKLPKQQRQRFRSLFVKMLEEPRMYSDFWQYEKDGRRIDVHVFGKHAIYFWDDAADRDLKIIRISKADGIA